MALRAKCGGCSKVYSLKDEMAGRAIRCKECGGTVRVPTSDSSDDEPDERPSREPPPRVRSGSASTRAKRPAARLSSGSSAMPILAIVIAIVVVGGGGVGAWMLLGKKNDAAPAVAATTPAGTSTAADGAAPAAGPAPAPEGVAPPATPAAATPAPATPVPTTPPAASGTPVATVAATTTPAAGAASPPAGATHPSTTPGIPPAASPPPATPSPAPGATTAAASPADVKVPAGSTPELQALIRKYQGISGVREKADDVGPPMRTVNVYDRVEGGITDQELGEFSKFGEPRLMCVHIRSERLTDAAILKMGQDCSLRLVEITGQKVTGSGFASFTDQKDLMQVTLRIPSMTAENVGVVARIPTLLSLRLNCQFDDPSAACEAIVKMKSMTFLNLAESNVDDNAVKVLSSSKKIEYLVLDKTKVTDAALTHLGKMKQLRSLDLTGLPDVTESGVAKFRKKLPNVEVKFQGK